MLGVQHDYADHADPVDVPGPLAPDFGEDGGLLVAHVVVVAQPRNEASTAIRDRRENVGDPAGGQICDAPGVDEVAQQDKSVVVPLPTLVDHGLDGPLDGAARPGTGIARNGDAGDLSLGNGRGRRSRRLCGRRTASHDPESEQDGYTTSRRGHSSGESRCGPSVHRACLSLNGGGENRPPEHWRRLSGMRT